MVATQDAALAAKLRSLRVHGETERYHHGWVGWNSRLDALQAAVLRVKLPRLEGWCRGRRANADRYDRLFEQSGLTASGDVRVPVRAKRRDHIFNQYTVRAERRDDLLAHLRKAGIGHAVYYPVPLHLQECFRDLGYGAGSLPRAEAASREVVSLPVYPELPPASLERVVETIAAFYQG
jgi:dTDP-4-amino-4,6-dideoxygalactose transaminase